MELPYGLQALARYKVWLSSENMLPATGNSLGDTWAIGENFWVWLVAPGAARADWFDP